MKNIAFILSVLALLASGCGNKKVPVDDSTLPFDYSTLPAKWTELMPTGIDGEFAVCDEANTVRINGNVLTFGDVAAGGKWIFEILNSYQINDTIVFTTYPYRECKFVWLDRERGIAEWISGSSVYPFVTDENLSKYRKINCSSEIEEDVELEDLVSSGETILKTIAGDLNDDGKDDYVIFTKQTDEEAFVSDEHYGELDCNRRGIVIAFKEGEDYNTVLAIPDCFPPPHEVGVSFETEVSISIKKGNLLIEYDLADRGRWYQYTFCYRNSDFELIDYEQTIAKGDVTKSIININFLTKERKTLINTNSDTAWGSEEFKETWQDIEMKDRFVKLTELVKLTDIKNFDDFNIHRYYYVER
ncbi:hypothetical protein AGMMS4957_17490 [Bacteroidia bacterium]|nr:hypothetical protein AGMMS4957_17490 [Bacteroidia bacterium]